MRDLTIFLISEIIGKDVEFSVTESTEGDKVTLDVVAPEDSVRLIIGKEGKTIKNIRKILAIVATQNKMVVNINVSAEIK
jgi:predicted RNA-binding protein YlqC (UPF0109 family)